MANKEKKQREGEGTKREEAELAPTTNKAKTLANGCESCVQQQLLKRREREECGEGNREQGNAERIAAAATNADRVLMATLLRGRTADGRLQLPSWPGSCAPFVLRCPKLICRQSERGRGRERGEREGSVKEPHWHCLAFCNIMSLGTTSSLCQASQPGKLYPATTFHCFSLPPLRSPAAATAATSTIRAKQFHRRLYHFYALFC